MERWLLASLSFDHAQLKQVPDALACIRQLLDALQLTTELEVFLRAVDSLAHVAVAIGRPDLAAKLLQAAASVRERAGLSPHPAGDPRGLEQLVDRTIDDDARRDAMSFSEADPGSAFDLARSVLESLERH